MKRLIKLLSLALCLTIVLSASLVGVFAMSCEGISLASLIPDEATPDEASPLFKDESVYVLASADGTVDRIIVSQWIQNNDRRDLITDGSPLDNLENVKGNESYTLDAQNNRVWQANGKDLFLKGDSKQPLPVDLFLTYELDGKAITPDELAGKSGDVTIRFDYRNNQYETVDIDGRKEHIYVPYMMLTGLLLDSEKFSEISVTNGKVISDGEHTIVAGIAFPGLQRDLDLDSSKILLPDYIEIKAHVIDFELGSTVTLASNGLFNKLDADKLNDVDSLKDSMSKLENAMDRLINGSSQLYEGLNTLLVKSGELTSGVDALADGASQLSAGASQLKDGAVQVNDGAVQINDGAIQLDDGAVQVNDGAIQLNDGAVQVDSGALSLSSGTTKLDAGAQQLSDGLSQLTQNNSALTGGSDLTFKSILSSARDALTAQGLDVPELTADNYAAVLQSITDSLSEDNVRAQAEAAARQQVTAAVETHRDEITAGVTQAVRQNVQTEVEAGVRAQVTEAVLANLGYSQDDYNAAVEAGLVDETVQQQVTAAIDAQMQSEDTVATIAALVDQNMESDTVKAAIGQNTEAQISALIEQNMQSEQVQQGISSAVAKAAAGVKSISALKAQLDQYSKFNTGLKAYTDGVAAASGGAGNLKSGTSQLKSGASQLKSGTSQLKSGTSQLKSGTSQLKSGTSQLKSGTSQLKSGTSQLKSGAESLSTGAAQLKDGVLTLKNGVPALTEGVTKLCDGSMQLSDGLKQLNSDGIDKLVKLVNGDIRDLATRVKAIIRVSKDYKSYTGLGKDMNGQVKYIYKTSEIALPEKKNK